MAAAAEAVENEVVRADYPFWIENNQIRFDDMKLQRHVEQYFMDYDDSSVDGVDDVISLDVVKYFKTLSALNPISARSENFWYHSTSLSTSTKKYITSQKEYYQQAVKLTEIHRNEAKIQKALLTNDVKGKRKVLIVALLAFLSFVQNQQQQKEKQRIKIIKFEQAVTIHIWPNLDECRNEMLLNIPVSMSCRIMKLAGMERMYVII